MDKKIYELTDDTAEVIKNSLTESLISITDFIDEINEKNVISLGFREQIINNCEDYRAKLLYVLDIFKDAKENA